MTVLKDALLAHRVVVCVGSGGVGKTTVSASLALDAALGGRKVLVLTIDPARRLANSLGLSTLGNVETRIDLSALDAEPTSAQPGGPETSAAGVAEPTAARPGRSRGAGELWAMTLDLSRTWDDLVTRYAPSPERRDRILQNRLYRSLSTQMAGSLEYMAMEKVYELEREGRYDLVVLDTPPTAHALDFIDAPNRLLDLFSHDAARWLFGGVAGAGKVGLSLVHLGSSYVLKTLARFTGTEMLQTVADFFLAFQGMYDGFKERAAATKALLAGPKSAFVLVTSPNPLAVDEAVYFSRELNRAGIAVSAAIVNRVHEDPLEQPGATLAPDIARALARERVPNEGRPFLSERLAKTVAELSALARRDHAQIDRFARETHGAFPLHLVPRLSRDVHDLRGLANVLEAMTER